MSPALHSDPPCVLRVLVVEDDPDTLATTVDMLRALGHWATGVGTAEAAQARYFDGAFDVVMTDVGLPALSGLDLAASLRERHPIRILFATGQPAPAKSLPGARWLQKPFGLDALADALNDLGSDDCPSRGSPSAAPAH